MFYISGRSTRLFLSHYTILFINHMSQSSKDVCFLSLEEVVLPKTLSIEAELIFQRDLKLSPLQYLSVSYLFRKRYSMFLFFRC